MLYELEECFNLSCSLSNVLDLDSRHVIITCDHVISCDLCSTDQKFSRHLIFVTHRACFASLHHVGMWSTVYNRLCVTCY